MSSTPKVPVCPFPFVVHPLYHQVTTILASVDIDEIV